MTKKQPENGFFGYADGRSSDDLSVFVVTGCGLSLVTGIGGTDGLLELDRRLII